MARSLQQIVELFHSVGQKPFRFQRSAWRAYREGSSGLIHSATGSGKTLAAWLGPILNWLIKHPNEATSPNKSLPLRVLWVTPLRALAQDTEQALRSPLEALRIPWTLESRTGDSKASLKARQLQKLPTALITTPESLTILLTHQKLLQQLAGLECVIVDEWHELLGTKRGVQTELALARLRKLNPELLTWGLSATLGNLDHAMESLLGNVQRQSGVLIRGRQRKQTVFEYLIPKDLERFPWAGHIGTKMVPDVAHKLEQVQSALIFTNTRSQTEIWYQHLLKHRPDWAGQIALHHGSLDASVRKWVEAGLRDGKLKAVVCTSSLDLGVDFTAVEVVVQVGSPKGAARLLQRAGRSGHQPGSRSRLLFVPTNAIELIELAAAQDAIRSEQLEARTLLKKPLDVLAQHAVTVAVGGGFRRDDLLEEVRTTVAYQALTDREWQWVLDFVVHGGSSLSAYPEFKRVEQVDDHFCVTSKRIATAHRMNIGTIASDAAMQVKFLSGRTLGTVEENFLTRLKEGDRFPFAGRLVTLVRIRDNTAFVRRSRGQPDAIPRWMGGRMALSSELSRELRRKIEEAADGILKSKEMRALKSLLKVQQGWSIIPRSNQLLIEQIKTRGGFQTFIFPFEGRLAHEGLAAVLALRLSRHKKVTFSMACNDYGLVLEGAWQVPIVELADKGLFAADRLVEDIQSSLNATEMTKRQFRQIARVAGLLQPGFPGRPKSSRYLQASSNLFFDVFSKYDGGNLLLEQARREVLDLQLETSRIESALDRVGSQQIVVTRPPKVTPFAFPLLVDKLRERVSSETLAERVLRMQAQLEKAAATLKS